jgi:hypothetical protein
VGHCRLDENVDVRLELAEGPRLSSAGRSVECSELHAEDIEKLAVGQGLRGGGREDAWHAVSWSQTRQNGLEEFGGHSVADSAHFRSLRCFGLAREPRAERAEPDAVEDHGEDGGESL